MIVVVTGASRGIGLELVRQFLARGDRVFAAVRQPTLADRLMDLGNAHPRALTVLSCDVTSDPSVQEMARSVTEPVDALVNNAGITGKRATFAELDFDDLVKTFQTNALGALRVSRALLPQLRQGSGKKILNISTGMGSMADNGSGGSWGYRLSKAALNMATKNLGLELADDGIRCVAVNPGWVKTDMGGSAATLDVDDSASQLIGVLDGMTLEMSGGFFNHDGTPYPW